MIIATIKSKATLNQPADAFIVGTPWGLRCDVFSWDQIQALRALTTKPLYLNMERILHPGDIQSFKEDLATYHSYADGIYFSDFAVVELAKELGIVDKLIYNPSTLVTNQEDVELFFQQGFLSVCLAKELTLDEITSIIEHYPQAEVFIHGYMAMFYAKRSVLKNFTTKHDYSPQTQATLTDETRDASYPIVEDEFGTHILQQHPLASFAEWDRLQAGRLRVDGYLVPEEEHHFVLQCYGDLARGIPVSTIETQVRNTLPQRTFTTGFYYKKTTYTQA